MEFNRNGSSSSSGFGFSPSSSFESLSASDPDSGFLFPKYPSSSFYRKTLVGPGPRFLPLAAPDDGGAGGTHHFLDACHLCKRPLGCGRDIFMYRGDTPFCSEECREEQIEMDEAGEKRAKMGQKQQQQQQQQQKVKGPSKSGNIRVRVSGTVVAG